MRVVKKPMKRSSRMPVHYLTGYHDNALREYSPAQVGNLRLVDQLTLTLDGLKHWFFHGDIFDATMKNARWLEKLDGTGHDLRIRINHWMNGALVLLGRPRMSFSKQAKNSVRSAVDHINDPERTMVDIAVHEGYATVACGHIHRPAMRTIGTPRGSVDYLNSGDRIGNPSALEHSEGRWGIHLHGTLGEDPAISTPSSRVLSPDGA